MNIILGDSESKETGLPENVEKPENINNFWSEQFWGQVLCILT